MWKAASRLLSPSCQNVRTVTIRHESVGRPYVLAIRREDFSPWERRAPLAPHHVETLVKNGVKVLVQPSNRRAYPMQAYANVGAHIQENLSESPLILGVKQVPEDVLEPEKTYVFFSHTIKAQEANMPLLDAILEKKIRLIDYERMTDETGRRVVAFGKYAGVAGMINILHGMGVRLLALGHHTPFMHIGPAHNYRSSSTARQMIRDAGYEIALDLMPRSLGPITFVFTGAGNVSQGAQEVFKELPHEFVDPKNLSNVARHGATNKVYGCVVDRADHLVHKDGKPFSDKEFEQHPERFYTTFSHSVAPYVSCLINCIYYAPNDPRLISIPDAKKLLRPAKAPWLPQSPGCPQLPHRLLAICDISADPGGSIEFMRECTTIDKPFCMYDAEQNMSSSLESFAGDGVLMCSIDNMPAQIPREATDYFGDRLMPHVSCLLKSDATTPFSEYDATDVVKNSVITSNGELTPKFQYIHKLREDSRSSHKAKLVAAQKQKQVLILGAGYVSAPVVDYLTRDNSVGVTVAAQFKKEVDALAEKYPNTTPVMLEMQRSQEEVEELVKGHDVVISLLPYSMHATVAKLCIKHKTNMVTASYRLPEMMALDKAAKDAGITVVNEVGLDPGIDHFLALQCFDEIREHGGKIKSYISWCGGLPAPENSDNALRYKFSWSPLGVLRNTHGMARYKINGEIHEVGGSGALLDVTRPMDFLPGLNLEGFPNRDSMPYAELYGITEAHTLVRGTLRFKGFSEAMKGLLKLGLLDLEAHPLLHPAGPEISWRSFMAQLMGQKSDILIDSLQGLIFEKLEQDHLKMNAIESLGLLNTDTLDKRGSPIETLSNYLSKRLAYAEGEKDLIVMHHEVGVEWPDGQKESRNIDFVVYGGEEYSAMAATVGYPTGIATRMVLNGEIQTRGVMLPFTREIYNPMLKRLKAEGLTAKETIIRGNNITAY